MEKCCSWDNGSVRHKDWPLKIYVGQWPIFHGPLILPFIIVVDLNYLYTIFLKLRIGNGRGYSCPSRHLLLVFPEVNQIPIHCWVDSESFPVFWPKRDSNLWPSAPQPSTLTTWPRRLLACCVLQGYCTDIDEYCPELGCRRVRAWEPFPVVCNLKNEPCHDKTCFCHMRTTKVHCCSLPR